MTEQDRHLQILLVEDNPLDVLMTRQALQDWEIKNCLYVVTNGNEALDFLYSQGDYVGSSRPDLVFLDLNIPPKERQRSPHSDQTRPCSREHRRGSRDHV